MKKNTKNLNHLADYQTIWPVGMVLVASLLAAFGWSNALISVAIMLGIFISIHSLADHIRNIQADQIKQQPTKGD